MTRSIFFLVCVLVLISFSACPWYKPEVQTTTCLQNEECGEGNTCRDGRCEDIYYPKRKVRQY